MKNTLKGIRGIGSRVEIARVYPPEQLPALNIEIGEDIPAQDQASLSAQDSNLSISVIVLVKSDRVAEDLNRIKAEVYRAMYRDRTLGFGWIYGLKWEGDTKPEFSGEQEIKTAHVEMSFMIQYQHSIVSKER